MIKFSTYLSLFLIIIIFIFFNIIQVFNIKSYDSIIQNNIYFSLDNGYTYNSSDSIFISKFSSPNESLFIIDYFKKDTIIHITNDIIEDLNKYKFINLNNRKTTDTIPPLNRGIYIIQLGSNDKVYRNMIFVNDIDQKNDDVQVYITLSDFNWESYNNFGGRSNYDDYITPYINKLFFIYILKINSNINQYFFKNYLI